jgi:hypothetical protein
MSSYQLRQRTPIDYFVLNGNKRRQPRVKSTTTYCVPDVSYFNDNIELFNEDCLLVQTQINVFNTVPFDETDPKNYLDETFKTFDVLYQFVKKYYISNPFTITNQEKRKHVQCFMLNFCDYIIEVNDQLYSLCIFNRRLHQYHQLQRYLNEMNCVFL